MSLSREEIIRMSREAGIVPRLVETTGTYFAHVEALANAAYAAGAAAERKKFTPLLAASESILELKGKIKLPTIIPILEAAVIRARGDK